MTGGRIRHHEKNLVAPLRGSDVIAMSEPTRIALVVLTIVGCSALIGGAWMAELHLSLRDVFMYLAVIVVGCSILGFFIKHL